MMLAIMLPVVAQRAAKSSTEESLYYAAFADVLESTNDLVSGAEKAYYYAIEDLDNDGIKELVMADINKLKTVYKVVNGKVQIISPNYTIDNDKVNWKRVEDFYVYNDIDRSKDITLKHHPMFAYDINILY